MYRWEIKGKKEEFQNLQRGICKCRMPASTTLYDMLHPQITETMLLLLLNIKATQITVKCSSVQ